MKEIIKTSKGKFIVTDDLDKINNWINNGKYEYICMLKRCEEKEASEIVDLYEFQHNPAKILYNLHEIGIRKWTTSAIKSLHSLLESQGIETTNNTYIFKI